MKVRQPPRCQDWRRVLWEVGTASAKALRWESTHSLRNREATVAVVEWPRGFRSHRIRKVEAAQMVQGLFRPL